jgi:hypothetical protein
MVGISVSSLCADVGKYDGEIFGAALDGFIFATIVVVLAFYV